MTEPAAFHQPLEIPNPDDLDHEPQRGEYENKLDYNMARLVWSWKLEDAEMERRDAKSRRIAETVYAVVYGVISAMWLTMGLLALSKTWPLAVLEIVGAVIFAFFAVQSWRRRG